ncbi:MAG TPA: TlpA disulfide reductase family protein [Alloprevotella sp.]|nr:TlpA disulfide reductase family protein [Alloprevotella sp.]
MSLRILFPSFILLSFLLAGCGVSDDRWRIEGRLDGIRQAEFYVYGEEDAFDGVDTIRIEDGKFSYERSLSQPAVLTLLYPNFSSTSIIAEPGKVIKMRGDAAKLSEADISGSKENELLTDFRFACVGKPENDSRLAAAQFVRDHPASLAALAVFRKYFATARPPDPAVVLPLLDVMKKAQPSNIALLNMEARLRPVLETGKGRSCPDFSAVSLTGEKLSRSDFSGRPFLVLFWATWNTDCTMQLQTVRRLQRAYPDRLQLMVVSLDASPEVCRRGVENDSLRSVMVCEGGAFASPLACRLGVRRVPGNLLVGADGKIVDRDVPVKELEERVARLLE